MNQRIINFTRAALSIIACAIVVTVVHAWTAPTAAPTGGNVPAPVNTGTVQQIKSADLGAQGFLAGVDGVLSSAHILAPAVHVGCQSGFACDLISPTTSTDIFNALLGGTEGIRVDSTGKTIIGGLLQISSGSPAAGDVLTSDASGNASWQAVTNSNSPSNIMLAYVGNSCNGDCYAQCPSGYSPVGGGGSCPSGHELESDGPIYGSGPSYPSDGTTGSGGYYGWQATCSQGQPASAYVVCASGATAYVVPPPAPTPKWYSLVASGEPTQVAPNDPTDTAITGGTYPNVPAAATLGESCATWMAGPLATTPPTNIRTQIEAGKVQYPNSYSVGHATGDCAYQFNTQVASGSYYYGNDSTLGGGVPLNPGIGNNIEQNTSIGGHSEIAGPTSSCQDLPSTFSRSDAKPVANCYDLNGVDPKTNGNISMNIWTDFYGL